MQASAMSSLYMNSRSGVPVPQTPTVGADCGTDRGADFSRPRRMNSALLLYQPTPQPTSSFIARPLPSSARASGQPGLDAGRWQVVAFKVGGGPGQPEGLARRTGPGREACAGQK